MNTKEVAAHFGVGPTTVKRWIDKGLFPNAKKITGRGQGGKTYDIPQEDVENFKRPKGRPGRPPEKQRQRKFPAYFIFPRDIKDIIDRYDNKTQFVAEAIREKWERENS